MLCRINIATHNSPGLYLYSQTQFTYVVFIYVSFAKEPYKKDDVPQKRPIILRSLLIVATPLRIHLFCCQTQFTCVVSIYGVASVSRIDKIIGLFCKRAL